MIKSCTYGAQGIMDFMGIEISTLGLYPGCWVLKKRQAEKIFF